MDKIVALCKRRGFVFPVFRDLRGDREHLRLRPLRRAAQEQRHRRVVEGDDPGARRRGGARLGDHPAPARLGGLGAPGRVHGPAGGLQGLQAALPGRPPRGGPVRQGALQAARRARRLRPHGRPRLQPDVRDLDRAGEGRRLHGLPAAGDRPGHLPGLQDHARVRAPQAALRHRPGGQVLSQRDHARQLRLPHARVRADGDGVLRAAGRGAAVARVLAGRAPRLVRAPRAGPRPAAPARARARGAVALLERHQRRRVPLPDRLVRARGHRQPRRLRPHPARGVLRREARVRGHGHPGALRPARDRAGRRRGPHHAGAALRRLRRGGGRGPPAHAAAAEPAPGSGEGGGAAAREPRRHARGGPRALRGLARRASPPSTTPAARSASATGARTRSAPPGASPWTARPSRTAPSRCATATRWSRCASGWTRSGTRSSGG